MSESRLQKVGVVAARHPISRVAPRPARNGFTLVELVITLTILSILTLGVMPLVRTSFKRQREQRLRGALAEMRAAIDDFHRDVIGGPCALNFAASGPPNTIYFDPRSRVAITDCTELSKVDNPDRYPTKLEMLVDGINVAPRPANGVVGGGGATVSTNKKIYLRRIPIDPMTGEAEWDLRSCYDAADATTWGGENVFDVRSKSNDTALNGEKYSEW